MHEISENTKAILLLTAPLDVGKKAAPSKILTLKAYNALAQSLHALGCQPRDLLGARLDELLSKLPAHVESARIAELLQRGFLLGQALAEWERRSIWVVSRADAGYPKRLKARLRGLAPPILYGCGAPELLAKGGLAVVGSRKISPDLEAYSARVGALAADAGVPLISGAARGIDRCAMDGALQQGGDVIGIMADSLGRAALAKANRDALREGRLVLISAFDPSAGFHVGHAMQRNKSIYAMADAGLVVTSGFNKGGTWSGAVEQLDRYHFAPVFVRNGTDVGEGNAALLQRGGKRWPEPRTAMELTEAIQKAVNEAPTSAPARQLGLQLKEASSPYPDAGTADDAEGSPVERGADRSPAERLLVAVHAILGEALDGEAGGDEIAKLLEVSRQQANTWLKALVERGMIEKLSRPVRYRLIARKEP